MNIQEKGTRTYLENFIFNAVARNVAEIFESMKGGMIFRDTATELVMKRLETQKVWF